MATKLYLRSTLASAQVAGTLPSGEQSAATADVSGLAAPLVFSTVKGSGQLNANSASLASAAQQKDFFRAWCSLPLTAQTIGNGTIVAALAGREFNLNANFSINALCIYLWRPSTGAKVATLVDMPDSLSLLAMAEPANTSQTFEMLASFSGAPGVSAAAGDIIVVELWAVFTQSSATAYTLQHAYGGTIDPTLNGAVAVSAASYISFPETITFGGGVASGDFAISAVGALAATGASIVAAAFTMAGQGSFTSTPIAFFPTTLTIAATSALTAVGSGIKDSVASFASTSDVAFVSTPSMIQFGVFTMEAQGEMAAVGTQYLPHVFAPEAPAVGGFAQQASLSDSWTKESPGHAGF